MVWGKVPPRTHLQQSELHQLGAISQTSSNLGALPHHGAGNDRGDVQHSSCPLTHQAHDCPQKFCSCHRHPRCELGLRPLTLPPVSSSKAGSSSQQLRVTQPGYPLSPPYRPPLPSHGRVGMPRLSLHHATAPIRLTTRTGLPGMAARVHIPSWPLVRWSHAPHSPKWRPVSVLDEYEPPPLPANDSVLMLTVLFVTIDGLQKKPGPSACASSWSSAAR